MALSASKTIVIIIAFSAIAFVFTSSLILSSQHAALAKPNKKDIDNIIKNLKDKIRDSNDDARDEEKDDDEEKEEEKVNTGYDYKFVAEGDDKLQNFNFAAAGDFGCSQNAKKPSTI